MHATQSFVDLSIYKCTYSSIQNTAKQEYLYLIYVCSASYFCQYLISFYVFANNNTTGIAIISNKHLIHYIPIEYSPIIENLKSPTPASHTNT